MVLFFPKFYSNFSSHLANLMTDSIGQLCAPNTIQRGKFLERQQWDFSDPTVLVFFRAKIGRIGPKNASFQWIFFKLEPKMLQHWGYS